MYRSLISCCVVDEGDCDEFLLLQISLVAGWKEVKKIIKEDPRYSKFSSSDRVCQASNSAATVVQKHRPISF